MARDHAPHQVKSVADGADQRHALTETLLDLVRFVLQRHHDLAVVSAGRYGVLTMALRQIANAIGRAANYQKSRVYLSWAPTVSPDMPKVVLKRTPAMAVNPSSKGCRPFRS